MDLQHPEAVKDAGQEEAKAERQFFLLKALEHTSSVTDAIDRAERMRRYVNEGEQELPDRPDLVATGEPHQPYR